MMRAVKPGAVIAGLVAAAAGLMGCPVGGGGIGPTLTVNPAAINFGPAGTNKKLSIYNAGAGLITWTINESIPWLSANTTAGTTTAETDQVTLTVDRSGLAVGTYNGTVTITSNGGTRVVSVAMSVAGPPNMEVSPLTLNFVNNQESATFTITNTGTGPLVWDIQLVDPDDPNETIPFPSFLSVDPEGGTTSVGQSTDVDVTIDRSQLDIGSFGFTLLISSNAGDEQVVLNITNGLSAEIGAEPIVLDFGTTQNVLTFDVFNIGFPGSVLDFTLSTDRPDLIFFTPDSGTSVATNDPFNLDRVTITVTIDRGALTGQFDGGAIAISAPGVDSLSVVVDVESAPLIFEGAENRSRPPFILRFVFLLRDALGRAIDTTDPAVFQELQTAFTIEEDGVPLDTDETTLFITPAEGLRYNLVLLLDYTGSMFNAGAGNGVVIDQMVSASLEFISDLPDPYRLAIMEYHERQQTNRLIHNFSTAKGSLRAALQAFDVPVGEHGASEVFDAVIDACQRLENEDLGVLAFDDADVRGVIFVSDGRDTSSINALEETITFAQDRRVRLYPIGFGENVNAAPLIQLATETGGHYYPAPTPADLINLLQNELLEGPAAPGVIVKELQRQIVLTYISLFQEGSHNYLISADYQGLQGSFQRDAVLAIGGDVRAGQVSLRTAGIEPNGTAEVFVRAEYVPRNVSQFRFRVISPIPFTVSLAQNGLLEDWFLVDNGGGVFTALTAETSPLQYGAFGNLIRVRFTGLNPADVIPLGFRIDNRVYVNPPFTKFFQYPDGIIVQQGSAQESVVPIQLSDGFDPDAPGAFDRDGDSVADFDDLFPDDANNS